VPAKAADNGAVTTTRSHRRAILAMVGLCAAVFVAALDQNMVYTIMKPLMTDLGLQVPDQLSEAVWIITGYLLGYTVAMPLFGRLTDVKGRRLMTLVALMLFVVGSALCVFVRQLDFFVVARVVQAAGGGALVPIAMAAGADMFPLRRRAFVLGIVAGTAEAGSVLGVVYGPLLALLPSALGLISNPEYWPLIFMVNIPLCLIIAAACWWLLKGELGYVEPETGAQNRQEAPDTREDGGAEATSHWWHRGQVDYVGAGLMAAALATGMIGLGTGSELLGPANTDQGSLLSWPWLAGAVVAFVLFVLYERGHPRPLVRLRFFKIPAFAAANVANFLVGVTLAIGMAGLSILGQTLFDLSPLGAGLFLIQLILPMPVGAVVGGWLADRIGCKITGVIGFLMAAAGYFLVSRWSLDPGFWTKLGSLVVAGIGLGFVLGPIGTSATTPVGQRWMATGSALVTVSRMVGIAIGLSAISSWGVRRVSALAARSTAAIVRTPDMSEVAYQARLQNARLLEATHQTFAEFFLIATVVIAIGVVTALFFYNHRERGTGHLPLLPQ
jgi:MFS family permease